MLIMALKKIEANASKNRNEMEKKWWRKKIHVSKNKVQSNVHKQRVTTPKSCYFTTENLYWNIE